MDWVNLRVTQQGLMMKVKHELADNHKQRKPVQRGTISEFTRQSRKRLVDLFATLDYEAIQRSGFRVKFITLTYEELMNDGEAAKLHLKRFLEWIKYHNPKMWCVWRLEVQKRGAIHFHLMVGNMKFTPKETIQEEWASRSGNPPNVFTRIEAIRSMRGIMRYCAKYMSKQQDMNIDGVVEDTTNLCPITAKNQTSQTTGSAESTLVLTIVHTFGRFWGVWGRVNIPKAEEMSVKLTLSPALYRWWLSIIDNPYCQLFSSFTVYQENVKALYQAVCGLFNAFPHLWQLRDKFERRKTEVYCQQTRNFGGAVYNELAIAHTTRQMKL